MKAKARVYKNEVSGMWVGEVSGEPFGLFCIVAHHDHQTTIRRSLQSLEWFELTKLYTEGLQEPCS